MSQTSRDVAEWTLDILKLLWKRQGAVKKYNTEEENLHFKSDHPF